MAGYRLPTLPEKRRGGAIRGNAARREPSSSLTYTPLKKTWRDQFGTLPGGPRKRIRQCCEPLRSSLSSRDWNRLGPLPQGAIARGEHLLRPARNAYRS